MGGDYAKPYKGLLVLFLSPQEVFVFLVDSVAEVLTRWTKIDVDIVKAKHFCRVDLEFGHVTAAMFFNDEILAEAPRGTGAPGLLMTERGGWYVPEGTPQEIASFITGWLVGQAGIEALPASTDKREPSGRGVLADAATIVAHGAGGWIALDQFAEGRRRAQSTPDE